MPQVTKKIFPTIVNNGFVANYLISPDPWPYENGSHDPIQATFDTSTISNIDSATLNVNIITATLKMYNSYSSSNLYLKLKLKSSNMNISSSENVGTGNITKTIDSTGISNIISRDACSFTIDIDDLVAYSGSNPDYAKDLFRLTMEMEGEEATYLEYVVIEPEINNFNVSGTSIDNDITCSWDAEDVSNWTVKAKLNGVVKATKTGTTAASCTFPIGTFNETGEYTFEITAVNGSSVTESKKVTLTGTQASISLLELPIHNINVDEAFTISWVSQNQTRFELNVGGNKYTGTTQRSVTVPKGTVGKGTKQVTLTVYFQNAYYSNIATVTDSFVGYGKPSPPTLSVASSYNSARPTLSWLSDEQTAYRVTIKQLLTTIEESGDVVSNIKYYIPSTALENNTTYQIEVQVKNKYGLWSDKATASFIVQFTMPNAPVIQAISDITTGSIVLNVNTDTTGDSEYKNTEIWKREKGDIWKRMAYKLQANDVWQDFYVAGSIEYEYKARNICKSGGISESEIVTARTECKGYTFYDVENTINFLRFETGNYPRPKINQPNIVSNLFANASAPTTFGDGTLYWTCSMTFTTTEQEDIYKLYELLKSKLLLYKDNKGHKWFGNIVNSPEFPEDDVEIITIQIEFTQAQFAEEDVYCGDNLELITWNGGWKFDGTHVFGGE